MPLALLLAPHRGDTWIHGRTQGRTHAQSALIRNPHRRLLMVADSEGQHAGMGGSPDTLAGSDLAGVLVAALWSALACCFSNRRPEDALSNNSRSDSVILEAASEAAEVSEEEVEEEEAEDEDESESLDELPEIYKARMAVSAQNQHYCKFT